MPRPRKYEDDASRRAAEAERKRESRMSGKPCPENSVSGKPGFVYFQNCPDVPLSVFDGRGYPREYKGRRYVMVARHQGGIDVTSPEHGVVTESDWLARLSLRCDHGRLGWACHVC